MINCSFYWKSYNCNSTSNCKEIIFSAIHLINLKISETIYFLSKENMKYLFFSSWYMKSFFKKSEKNNRYFLFQGLLSSWKLFIFLKHLTEWNLEFFSPIKTNEFFLPGSHFSRLKTFWGYKYGFQYIRHLRRKKF